MTANWRSFRPKSKRSKIKFDPGRNEIEYAVALFLFEGGNIEQISEPKPSVSHQKQIDARLYQNDTATAHDFLMGNHNII